MKCISCEANVVPPRQKCDGCKALVRMKWYERQKKSKKFHKKEAARSRAWRAVNPGYKGRKTKPPHPSPEAQKRYKTKYRAKPGIREAERASCRAYYAAHRAEILARKKRRRLEAVISRHLPAPEVD